MKRSLLASVLGLAIALAIAGSAAAMPVGRSGSSHKPSCRTMPKRHLPKRCRRHARRHRTRPVVQVASTPRGAPTASSAPEPIVPPTSAVPAPASTGPAPTPPAPIQVPPIPLPVPSAWDRPALSNPATVPLTASHHVLVLSQSQDYILQCPPGGLELPGALNVWGGRNVVLENCDLDLGTTADWAARFSDQSGTLWIHDVHFGGSELTGGMQLQEPGATVVMRDVLFDKVYGSLSTNHAELIQTWAGPARLMIDGLTGSTTYQGLFLEPNQYDSGPPPSVFDLRQIDIDDSQGAYALWLGAVTGSPPGDTSGAILSWNVQDVHVVPNPARTWPGWWLWPQPSTGDPTWATVIAGAPSGGSYVRATSSGATGVDESTSPPALVGETP